MGDQRFHGMMMRDPKAEALEKKAALEKRRAEAQMAYDLANLNMPEDIRERARVWGMEAWAEVLWNNAFQCGYREALRGQSDAPTPPRNQ